MLGENVAMTPKPKESYIKPDTKENIQWFSAKRANFSASAEQLDALEASKDQSKQKNSDYDTDFKLVQGN